jgi:hypothetical protein
MAKKYIGENFTLNKVLLAIHQNRIESNLLKFSMKSDLKEKTLQDLNKLISNYLNYEKSFLPIDLKILAENCIKLINGEPPKDF